MPFLHARDFPNSDDPNIKATNFYTRNTNAFSLYLYLYKPSNRLDFD